MEDPVVIREERPQPTWAGWAVLLSAPAFFVAGLLRKDPAMVTVGVLAAAAVGLAFIFARRHGRDLRFQISLPPHCEAGRRFVCRVCVRNTSRWCDVWRLRWMLRPLAIDGGDAAMSWVAASGTAVADVEVVAASRGVLTSVGIEWTSDAPFGLMTTWRAMQIPTAMRVRPKPVWPWKNHQHGAAGRRTLDASPTAGWGESGEPRGARSWRSGDRARNILWPASVRSMACGGSWMVRESDPPMEGWASYTVVFHSHGGGGALIRPDSFELALCHVAGVVKSLLAEGRRVRLVADFDDWRAWECRDGHSLARLLDFLSSVKRAVGTEAHEIARVLDEVKPEDGILVLSDFPLDAWRTAIPESARRAWLPDAARGRRKRLEVAV